MVAKDSSVDLSKVILKFTGTPSQTFGCYNQCAHFWKVILPKLGWGDINIDPKLGVSQRLLCIISL
jgi:hypothetical protein